MIGPVTGGASSLGRDVDRLLRECGLEVSAHLVESTVQYISLLQKWSSRINLTGLKCLSDLVRTHFAESFLAARHLDEGDNPILDIGSGAGFPGMAMKLYRPDLTVYLLEPRKKRASFLSTVRRELGLSKVIVINKTLERCGESDLTEGQPALLTIRALSDVKELIYKGLHLSHARSGVILFSTAGRLAEILVQLPQITWEPPVFVPWSRERIILLGRQG
jgi:16S rRNA (guanine527-N7)-methyltransferase